MHDSALLGEQCNEHDRDWWSLLAFALLSFGGLRSLAEAGEPDSSRVEAFGSLVGDIKNGDTGRQERALLSLVTVAAWEDKHAALLEAGVVDALKGVLSSRNAAPNVTRLALQLIFILAANSKNHAALASTALLQKVVASVKSDTSPATNFALAALVHLSKNAPGREALGAAGAGKAVSSALAPLLKVSAASLSTEQLEVARQAVLALTNLVSNHSAQVLSKGGVECLVHFAAAPDALLARNAIQGLVEAAKDDSKHSVLLKKGAIEALAAASTSPDVQTLTLVCAALAALANPKSHSSAAVAGRLDATALLPRLTALVHHDNAGVQSAAANAVAAVASNERCVRGEIKAGGVEEMQKALFSANPAVATAALTALAHMSTYDMVADSLLEVPQLLARLTLLVRSPDPSVAGPALSLLASLATAVDAGERIVRDGSLSALLASCLRPNQPDIQLNASAALLNVCSDPNAQALVSYGFGGDALGVLAVLLKSPDANIRASASKSITHLSSTGFSKVIVSQNPAALHAFLDLAAQAPDSSVRVASARVILNIAENTECGLRLAQAGAFERLLELATASDPSMRHVAACAFAYLTFNSQLHQHIKENKNMDKLLALLASTDVFVRRYATTSLCNIASSESTHDVYNTPKLGRAVLDLRRSNTDPAVQQGIEGLLINLSKKGPVLVGVEPPPSYPNRF